MTQRGTQRALCAALLAAAAMAAGCGQRGPLSLPDSARPIQRVDPNAAPAQPPAAPAEPTDEEKNGNER
ncbi:MAG TPA: lipoprotein [Gammaproteobacteria bacterium]|nr:lipoprotein [Gammaproteobacteria bacterium]